MSTVSAVASSTGTTSTAKTSTEDTEDLYNTWITILATQLQNQDPTDPVDATQFTSQLISLASLEQQSLTNDTLSSVLESVEALQADGAFNYLGATVTAVGQTAPLTDGSATWLYSLPSEAQEVTLTVTDQDGTTIYETEGETSAGTHTLTWDGTTDDGDIAEDGAYTLTVTAVDESGEEIEVDTYISGVVTGIGTDSDSKVLLLDSVYVDRDNVVSALMN